MSAPTETVAPAPEVKPEETVAPATEATPAEPKPEEAAPATVSLIKQGFSFPVLMILIRRGLRKK